MSEPEWDDTCARVHVWHRLRMARDWFAQRCGTTLSGEQFLAINDRDVRRYLTSHVEKEQAALWQMLSWIGQ